MICGMTYFHAAALLCTGATAAGSSVFGAAGLLCTAGLAAGSSFPLLCVLRAALARFKRFAFAAPVQVVFCLTVILRQLVLLKGGTGVALFQRLDGFVEQQHRLCAVCCNCRVGSFVAGGADGTK